MARRKKSEPAKEKAVTTSTRSAQKKPKSTSTEDANRENCIPGIEPDVKPSLVDHSITPTPTPTPTPTTTTTNLNTDEQSSIESSNISLTNKPEPTEPTEDVKDPSITSLKVCPASAVPQEIFSEVKTEAPDTPTRRTTRSQSRERELPPSTTTTTKSKKIRRNSTEKVINDQDIKKLTSAKSAFVSANGSDSLNCATPSKLASIEESIEKPCVSPQDKDKSVISEVTDNVTPNVAAVITPLENIALPSDVVPKVKEGDADKGKTVSESHDDDMEKEDLSINDEALELEAEDWKEDSAFWSNIPLPPKKNAQHSDKDMKASDGKLCEKSNKKDSTIKPDELKKSKSVLSGRRDSSKSDDINEKDRRERKSMNSKRESGELEKNKSNSFTLNKSRDKDLENDKSKRRSGCSYKSDGRRSNRNHSSDSNSSESASRKKSRKRSSSRSSHSSSPNSPRHSKHRTSRHSPSRSSNRQTSHQSRHLSDRRRKSSSPKSSRRQSDTKKTTRKYKPIEISFDNNHKSRSRSTSPNDSNAKERSPKLKKSDSVSLNEDHQPLKCDDDKDDKVDKVDKDDTDKEKQNKPELPIIDYASFKSSRKVSLSCVKPRDDEIEKPKKRKWGSECGTDTLAISSKFLQGIIPDVEPLSASELHLSNEESSASELEEGETASVEGPEPPPLVPSKDDLKDPGGEEELDNDYDQPPTRRRDSRPDGSKLNWINKRDVREVSPIRSRRRSSAYDNGEYERPARKIRMAGPMHGIKPAIAAAAMPISKVIHIVGLVRPFTVQQLKTLLQRTGQLVKPYFWLDKVKSVCLAKFETEDEALETRMALHGVTWPSTNPKTLCVDFSTEEKLLECMANSDSQCVINSEDVKEHRWKRDQPVREWDLAKLGEHSPGDKERERERQRREWEEERLKEKRRKKGHSRSPEGEKATTTEEAPPKTLDDLFRKTKAQPSIYWLPLTPEQIGEKEAQRRKKMVDHERAMAELQVARENERQEKEKLRLEREKERVKEREKEKEKAKEREREREKERERERERDKSRNKKSRSRSRRRSRSSRRSSKRSPRRSPRHSPRRSPQRSRRSPSRDSRSRRRTHSRSRSRSRSRS